MLSKFRKFIYLVPVATKLVSEGVLETAKVHQLIKNAKSTVFYLYVSGIGHIPYSILEFSNEHCNI